MEYTRIVFPKMQLEGRILVAFGGTESYDVTVGIGESYNFKVRHARCVEYKLKCNIKIYSTVIHNFICY